MHRDCATYPLLEYDKANALDSNPTKSGRTQVTSHNFKKEIADHMKLSINFKLANGTVFNAGFGALTAPHNAVNWWLLVIYSTEK